MGKKGGGFSGIVGGFLSDMTGGGDVAKYGGRVAAAQQAEARRQYDSLTGMLNTSAGQMDNATVQGLASLDRDIANQERNLQRQEKLISQIDPTIIEASQQALRLLRGEESSTLSPLKAQRAQQRQKLLNSLREQLGPGAETSTAGMQALNRFDSESANLFGAGQQNALQMLGNISGQFSSQRPDMMREVMGLSGLGQGQYGLRANQANFGLQRVGAQQSIGSLLTGTAGLEHTKGLLNAQSRQQQLLAHQEDLREMGKAWGTMGMSSMGGGGSGKATTANRQSAGGGTRYMTNAEG